MPRYRLTIEYDGGPFVGWQRQANGESVQGALEAAVAALTGAATTVQGAGRTDSGVHALGQAAHFDLASEWEGFRLREALNHFLRPAPVAVIEAARAADAFHARFDAIERRYLYRIIRRRAPLTLERGRAWRVAMPLDAEAMKAGAAHLVGRHDFTTFRSSLCQARSPIKTLDELSVAAAGDELTIRARARSFLHNQVRSLVGTLVEIGAGRWAPDDAAAALAARDRARCGPVAPPEGLYLEKVVYPQA